MTNVCRHTSMDDTHLTLHSLRHSSLPLSLSHYYHRTYPIHSERTLLISLNGTSWTGVVSAPRAVYQYRKNGPKLVSGLQRRLLPTALNLDGGNLSNMPPRRGRSGKCPEYWLSWPELRSQWQRGPLAAHTRTTD